MPALCLCEVSHLIEPKGGWHSEVRLIAGFAGGDLHLECPHPVDFERIAELIGIYRDLPLGTVDAAVVAAAERLEITQIATLDRRHFSVVRPRHVEAFELLP
ncbi:MAG: VapC toxin family PIN domain ribonuclease [Actinomycetota bacterium]|nr:VapC toxin family PIN domain ribonuclease [Actinomycetota bacterium]